MKTAKLVDRAFWDSSGLVLLCAHQPSTPAARRVRARTAGMAIWWGTPVEVRSALQRLHREGGLGASELSACRRRLVAMEDAALEVAPTEAVRVLAAACLERFDLRAADALQLAAALVLCREHPRGRTFVCFDQRLAAAADLAGFTVLTG